jgi:predicted enzyme related to lactoylglutathione lyase
MVHPAAALRGEPTRGSSMNVQQFTLNYTIDQPDRLFAFYRDTVGLEVNPDMGDHALNAGGAVLFFDGHSETHGKAKEPQRYLVSFFVEDIASEQARLKAAGVPFVREMGKEYWGGVISTFLDPDGNYGQLIQYTPA